MVLRLVILAVTFASALAALAMQHWLRITDRIRRRLFRLVVLLAVVGFGANVWISSRDYHEGAKNAHLLVQANVKLDMGRKGSSLSF